MYRLCSAQRCVQSADLDRLVVMSLVHDMLHSTPLYCNTTYHVVLIMLLYMPVHVSQLLQKQA